MQAENIQFHTLQPGDTSAMELIAGWYQSEWNIPVEKTIARLQKIASGHEQFQVLMSLDNIPIATGGLYDHVGLIDKEPRFGIYKNWLTLVYTKPENRKKGYGALLCSHIQDQAKKLGVIKMYLFTDTAEHLYKRLGWTELERLAMGERNIVVMQRVLTD